MTQCQAVNQDEIEFQEFMRKTQTEDRPKYEDLTKETFIRQITLKDGCNGHTITAEIHRMNGANYVKTKWGYFQDYTGIYTLKAD